jgi:hypothetical protein
MFAFQQCISAHSRGFHLFRAGFLLFALGVIGLYAQGQLSVVNMHARQVPPVRLAQAHRRLRQTRACPPAASRSLANGATPLQTLPFPAPAGLNQLPRRQIPPAVNNAP